ncbi:hypothetical protein C8F04DRAFT_1030619 [Mycena alexandri]|uniref:AttH domain-containing protein n=1 Tax=Mycena alexandri TaxID=1745969 RepID=A0AAD6XBC6_9AGAR|nr:hypothetical protein C8F04DRAFT_1030619 [Mycena alexandri]
MRHTSHLTKAPLALPLCTMTRKLVVAFFSVLSLVTGTASHVYHIPAAVGNDSSAALFTSAAADLDGAKIRPVNATAYDWWYFDVVSTDPDSLASVVVVFYTATPGGFPFLPPSDSVTVAQIFVSFPNGTTFNATANADDATVITDNNVSSGEWVGSGLSWNHTGFNYAVVVDAPDIGVQGTISFNPIAPAHYPCGPAEAGQNMQVGPGIGWSNAIPDAVSSIELTVGGTLLSFTGAGYHDKNWSNQPFTSNVGSWYWGHGRLGPYSFVWFDYLALDGTEFVSGYAAKYGTIISASCESGSISVRPTGKNAIFPPVLSTGNPSGYHITFNLEQAGTLEMDVSVLGILVDSAPYTRFVGNISGVIVPAGNSTPRNVLQGTALYEQFKLTN